MELKNQITNGEIANRGTDLYANLIRSKVETPDNIGKMVVIDVETGDFGVDKTGFETSSRGRYHGGLER